jgi:hypothetical protein
MKLEAGDIIQVDGGNAIVTQVKGDRALIAAIGDLGGRSGHALKNGVELEITRNRLVERRGETGLAEFFAERNSNAKHERKGQIKTEPGDRLCYEGAICVVASVTGSKCEIAHPDGRTFTDDRWLNEFFFRDCSCHKLMRLTAEQREANLKELKAVARPKASAKASEKTPKPEKEVGKRAATGRAAYTRNLASTTDLGVAEIHAMSKAAYPSSDMATTMKLVESERSKSK